MKHSYIFLADGFEEIEALCTVDVARRAGMPIRTVSVNDSPVVTGAHGVSVNADLTIGQADLSDPDWLILPGGMPGASNLADCKPLCDALEAHAMRGGHIAAICAAPAVVLGPLGILGSRQATCYPSFTAECRQCGAEMVDSPVVVDRNIVTGQGPAAALVFALAIANITVGEAASREVGSGMLYYPKQINYFF